MKCKDSRPIDRLSRWLMYACQNVYCGGTFRADLQITHEISPSALPSAHLGLRRLSPPPANDNGRDDLALAH